MLQALKKFLGVSKHFEDFVEDQFDFHGYCIRKMTLRSYIELLRMEDTLYGELSFSKVCERLALKKTSILDPECLLLYQGSDNDTN